MEKAAFGQLNFRYKALFVVIVWAAIALSAYPTWVFAAWFADVLGIPPGAPVKDQEHGDLWAVGFLVVGSINLFICCAVICGGISKYKGWSRQQALDYFVRYKYPAHWMKPTQK